MVALDGAVCVLPIAAMDLPLVFMQGAARPTMGLSALDPAEWLWLDERHAAETAERARLIAEQPQAVHAMLPEAESAADELLALARMHLGEHHLAYPLPSLTGEPPLLQLGRLVQEDFCLLQQGTDSAYRLTGAILCFPSHWRLQEKIGLPLSGIHAPVPGFAERLAGPVDRFFVSLRVERPVWRANWTIVESPALFHPQPREPVPDLSGENAGERLWLRVERQTLRRLSKTRAVVFTIRTLIEPLAVTARRPGAAPALAARIRDMDEALAAYKGIPAVRTALLAFLDHAAEERRRTDT